MSTSSELRVDVETESGLPVDYLFDAKDRPFKTETLDTLCVNPLSPTEAKPGSFDKVTLLAARYASGLPLWHDGDCVDHGPIQSLLELDA